MSTTESERRSPFSRGKKDDGPRASFRQLLPYLGEHRVVIGVVVALSIVGAATSLAQPLLVSQVITVVQKGQPLGLLVFALIALVVVSAILSGVQHYLLQRTGTSVVLTARQRLVRCSR
jgi:ABC-type bacteriocin/lantibiotic exporter with double-glycine peptidase domain